MRNFLISTLIIGGLIIAHDSTAMASSTVISSHISAVRIIVVDNSEQITEIYSNTNEDIVPDVRLNGAAGKKTMLSKNVAQQYAGLKKSIPRNGTGKVYDHHPLPSLILTLYAML